MTDDRDDVVILLDENGEEVKFEYIDTIEMNGSEYVVLAPQNEGAQEDDESEGSEEVIILKIEHSNDDEDTFISIDNEDELNEVFEEFKQRMEDEYDFDEQ